MSLKKKSELDECDVTAKQLKVDETDRKLTVFLTWCEDNGLVIDFKKVKVTRGNCSHNIGMVAIEDIKEHECIARIPKRALLEANNTSLKDLISQNASKLKSKSNWSKLIISLMYESSRTNSKWSPYLNLFPNYELLDLPMFWNSEELDNLKDMCIFENVQKDLENIKAEYESIILPFITINKDKFSDQCFDFEFYKKLVGFIMAYSFMDPAEDPSEENAVGPVMVPVADILNHIALNNAQLRFGENELKIHATKPIKKGQEVYNTYGEHSNADLLHMYGFVETFPNNAYDNVEIPTKFLVETLKNLKNNEESLLDEKIKVFYELDLIDENVSIVIGNGGVLNEDQILQLLQIYSMPREEFTEFCDNDYELEEEVDEVELTAGNMNSLPIDWKNLIVDTCDLYLNRLSEKLTNLKEEQLDLVKQRRIKTIKCLVDGHVKILKKFLNK